MTDVVLSDLKVSNAMGDGIALTNAHNALVSRCHVTHLDVSRQPRYC